MQLKHFFRHGFFPLLCMVGIILIPVYRQCAVGLTGRAEKKSNIFIFPVENGKKSAAFGPIRDPFTQKERFHKGIDIAAKQGTPVFATCGGEIIKTVCKHSPGVGSGKYIIIDHKNGYKTRYTQLDSILVQKGQSVQTGQTIARVGSSGRSTGPHLHFEILYHDKPVNPEDYIQF